MRRKLILLSVLTVTGWIAQAAAAPALDTAGKCRDNGKFVAAKLCAVHAVPARCRDIKTKKFAKCGTAGTEPVTAAK